MARVAVVRGCPPLFSPNPSGITDHPNGYSSPESPPSSTGGAGGRSSPSVQEQGQPQAVELVGDLRVEEGQEAADLVQAVHLQRQAGLGGDGGSAHTPEPQGATDGSQGHVVDDATCQLGGMTLGGVGHSHCPGTGEGATEHPQCPSRC